jgi:hypothetical protein
MSLLNVKTNENEDYPYPLFHLGEKESTLEKAINNPKLQKELIAKHNLDPDGFLMELKKFEEQRDKNFKGGYQMKRKMYANGSLLEDDMAMMEEEEMPTHVMPDGTVMPGAEHEESETPMEESREEEMDSDSEMEDNYLDFIINEALTEEEEDMLMSKLEQDEELSMLFDKVIEVASEFAGSGPVEGPGTGVSDSIPARLSDGEFVFTAKAVEEIGADNLMAMMKDAEMKADERQGMAVGGNILYGRQDEENRNVQSGIMPEKQLDTSAKVQEEMLRRSYNI